MSISSVPELVAELAAGRMVILVDEEDRENEGDLVIAADHVTAESINFMARFGRGLICLTLTRERCERLRLEPMVRRNGTKHGTAFTVSIEASNGVSTGISAADRARTVMAAVACDARASDLVQPGHVFPLQAADGGVLMRAGHTEAGCDLARMAGLTPAAVICEVMKDDGTMARLPDLVEFGRVHGLKVGTIAALVEYRHRNESMIERVADRKIQTLHGDFDCVAFSDRVGGLHLALTRGEWSSSDEVLVRVHESPSVMDLLDARGTNHSWPLSDALAAVHASGRGAALLLNCGDGFNALLKGSAQENDSSHGISDLRTYGVGAQILRALGISRMKLLGGPRRMRSLIGYGLEITGSIEHAPGDWIRVRSGRSSARNDTADGQTSQCHRSDTIPGEA